MCDGIFVSNKGQADERTRRYDLTARLLIPCILILRELGMRHYLIPNSRYCLAEEHESQCKRPCFMTLKAVFYK